MSKIIFTISSASVLLPVVAGLVTFRRHSDPGVRAMWIYFIVVAINQSVQTYYRYQIMNNIWTVYVFMLLFATAIPQIMAYWHGDRRVRIAALVASLLYAGYWVLHLAVLGSISVMSNEVGAVAMLIGLVFAGFALYAESGRQGGSLTRNPRFWFASGVMVYASVSIVIHGVFTLIHNNRAWITELWVLYSYFNIFAHAVYAVGFLCSSPRRTLQPL